MVVRIFNVASGFGGYGEKLKSFMNELKGKNAGRSDVVIEKAVRPFELADKLKNIQNGDTVGLVFNGTSSSMDGAFDASLAIANNNDVRTELARAKGIFLACDKPNESAFAYNTGKPENMFVTNPTELLPLELGKVDELRRVFHGLRDQEIYGLPKQMLIYSMNSMHGLRNSASEEASSVPALNDSLSGFMDRLIAFDKA